MGKVLTIMNKIGLCENICTQTTLNFGYEIGRTEEDCVDLGELTDRAEVRHCIVEDCGTLYAPFSNTFPVPTCRARVRSGGQEVARWRPRSRRI